MSPAQRAALETIIRQTETLPRLAQDAGFDFLAYLLEQPLHEARSILMGAGYEAPTRGRPVASVVPMVKPKGGDTWNGPLLRCCRTLMFVTQLKVVGLHWSLPTTRV